MSDAPPEPSYYEIALTNRQVLVAFVLILGSVLVAFLSGVWLGQRGGDTVLTGEMQLAELEAAPIAPSEDGDGLERLEKFRFFDGEAADPVSDGGPARPLKKPDLSALRGGSETTREAAPTAAAPATPPPPPVRAPAQDPPPARPSARAPAVKAAPAAETGEDRFIVQVFSSHDREQAEKVLAQLREAEFRTFIAPLETSSGTMYRVRVGPFRKRARADKEAENVRAKLKLDTWVTAAGR